MACAQWKFEGFVEDLYLLYYITSFISLIFFFMLDPLLLK